MALVYEKVKEEDWDLYNSFLPNIETADKHTRWVIDRENNTYFFWVGGDYRDSSDIYFMSWNNIKIYVDTESHSIIGGGTYMWINRILIYKMLDSEIVEEIVDTIKDALQIQYENPIKFQKIANPTFKEEKK